ncbi:MAG: DUF1993 domain-containing protein [Phenylobacterium sp.]|uniref:DUF1993 domain-containing protein n=1 Tax=Phenylobacterium sp. TaxID=1871053 RepID=UPI001A458439|nr:DUF1993 domain-containing protein [Phenylobacterium sp.]MBL8772608.1 DUF1993 domain-containing protein [Phenylobacterium sp.]
MAVDLFTFVGMYDRALGTLGHVLDRGAERARALGASEAEMLEWRLIDDMNPLSFQARVVINFTKQWTARVAGLEVPPDIATDLDVAGLKAEIANAKAWLAALKPEQFAGRDDVVLKISLGQLEPTFSLGQWLASFATTNVYFHLSMAYAILRARGANLGKVDLFAGGL